MSLGLVSTLLKNPKGPVELGNPNTCAEVKLYLFLFTSALKIVCRETKVFETRLAKKLLSADKKKPGFLPIKIYLQNYNQ